MAYMMQREIKTENFVSYNQSYTHCDNRENMFGRSGIRRYFRILWRCRNVSKCESWEEMFKVIKGCWTLSKWGHVRYLALSIWKIGSKWNIRSCFVLLYDSWYLLNKLIECEWFRLFFVSFPSHRKGAVPHHQLHISFSAVNLEQKEKQLKDF